MTLLRGRETGNGGQDSAFYKCKNEFLLPNAALPSQSYDKPTVPRVAGRR